MASLGEVAREVVFRESGAVSEASVVAVVAFVGASHCRDHVNNVPSSSGMTLRLSLTASCHPFV